MAVLRSSRWRSTAVAVAACVVAPLTVLPGPASAQSDTGGRDVTTFACIDDLPSPFEDTEGNVHEVAIGCVAIYGITTGRTETTYDPQDPVTRGQMASFIYRALTGAFGDIPVEDQGFTDIEGNIHEDAINAIAGLGIANGTTATTYSPSVPVRRDQMASFLARTLDLLVEEGTSEPHA